METGHRAKAGMVTNIVEVLARVASRAGERVVSSAAIRGGVASRARQTLADNQNRGDPQERIITRSNKETRKVKTGAVRTTAIAGSMAKMKEGDHALAANQEVVASQIATRVRPARQRAVVVAKRTRPEAPRKKLLLGVLPVKNLKQQTKEVEQSVVVRDPLMIVKQCYLIDQLN